MKNATKKKVDIEKIKKLNKAKLKKMEGNELIKK